jgi:hypothetical protein
MQVVRDLEAMTEGQRIGRALLGKDASGKA